MRRLFLVNPTAGRGAGLRIWRQVAAAVAKDLYCEVAVPANTAETRVIAAEAARSGIKRVIVIGGDGTVSAVAGALAGTETSLAVIPAGTGNDYCRNTNIPLRSARALPVALYGPTFQMDLGRVKGIGYFVNAAGIGFDAKVAQVARSYPKGMGGTLPYLLGALTTLPRYNAVEIEINVDGDYYHGPAMMVAVANGRCYGGGMQIAPAARADDGLLDVTIACGVTRLQLLGLLGRVYSGSHVNHPLVRVMRGRTVSLQAYGPVQAHIDGEPCQPQKMEFEACPKALSVVMPARVDWATGDLTDMAHRRYGSSNSLLWWDK